MATKTKDKTVLMLTYSDESYLNDDTGRRVLRVKLDLMVKRDGDSFATNGIGSEYEGMSISANLYSEHPSWKPDFHCLVASASYCDLDAMKRLTKGLTKLAKIAGKAQDEVHRMGEGLASMVWRLAKSLKAEVHFPEGNRIPGYLPNFKGKVQSDSFGIFVEVNDIVLRWRESFRRTEVA